MIVLKKSHQNLSDYIQFIFKKKFELNQKMNNFLWTKWKIQLIFISMIMLTRSSESQWCKTHHWKGHIMNFQWLILSLRYIWWANKVTVIYFLCIKIRIKFDHIDLIIVKLPNSIKNGILSNFHHHAWISKADIFWDTAVASSWIC